MPFSLNLISPFLAIDPGNNIGSEVSFRLKLHPSFSLSIRVAWKTNNSLLRLQYAGKSGTIDCTGGGPFAGMKFPEMCIFWKHLQNVSAGRRLEGKYPVVISMYMLSSRWKASRLFDCQRRSFILLLRQGISACRLTLHRTNSSIVENTDTPTIKTHDP